MAVQHRSITEGASSRSDTSVDAVPGTCYRARLFGAFALTSPDGSDAAPPGRKARALLAYLLATADDGAALRERLAALLWSERADGQARASLRQAFHEIRSLTVGDRPLVVVDRSRARVVRERVVTDLDGFHGRMGEVERSVEADLRAGRLPELLADLNDVDPAFDDWLASERRRRGDALRARVLERIEEVLATGDAPHAQGLANTLLAADPLDEAAARAAMLAAQRRGQKDSVRLVHTRLVQALQQELGASPTVETTELHRRLMAMPASTEPDTAAPVVPGSVAVTAEAVRAYGGRRWRRRGLAVAIATAVCFGGVAVRVVALRSGSATAPRVLAVEPLRVPGDDGPARTLDRGLSADLARMIVGNDAVLSVTDSPRGVWARGTAPDYLLAGDAQSQSGLLHVDVKLRRGSDPSAAILWSHAYSRPTVEVDALREQIATSVADVAVCALGGRNPGIDELGVETMRLYLAACEQKHADADEAKKLLTQVVARQPAFAHGWAMLAAATALAANSRPAEDDAERRRADTEAARALALNPNDGEAFLARAFAVPGLRQWPARVAILQAGQAVDPTNAGLNATLAVDLSSAGHGGEALAYSRRGWAFDPFSPVKASMLARQLAFSGDIDGANAVLQSASRRFPGSEPVARTEFLLAALVGDARRAAELLVDPRRGFDLSPEQRARWQTVLAARLAPSAANVDAAVGILVDPAGQPNRRGVPLLFDLARLNRTDLAFAQAGQMTPAELEGDTDLLFSSAMAPLRADRRFMALAARAGLASLWQESGRWPDFCRDRTLTYDCRAEARHAVSVRVAAASVFGR